MVTTIDNALFAARLDYTMFVEPAVLGRTFEAAIPNRGTIFLDMPGEGSNDQSFDAPQSAVAQLSGHIDSWGAMLPDGIAEVEAVLIRVPCHAEVDFDIEQDQVGGADLAETGGIIREWLDQFCIWIWASTAQSLDINHPDPKMIHRKSSNLIQVATAGDKSSYAATVSSFDPIAVDFTGGASSERVADVAIIERAVAQAGVSRPSVMMESLASARMFRRRGDCRRAIIDAALVAEAALTAVINPSKKTTLGPLVLSAPFAPSDAITQLVQPRNAAVHEGIAPSFATADRAIEIAESMALYADSTLRPANSLRHVSRPTRIDLEFIKSPKS